MRVVAVGSSSVVSLVLELRKFLCCKKFLRKISSPLTSYNPKIPKSGNGAAHFILPPSFLYNAIPPTSEVTIEPMMPMFNMFPGSRQLLERREARATFSLGDIVEAEGRGGGGGGGVSGVGGEGAVT